jgi:hypothetical protein
MSTWTDLVQPISSLVTVIAVVGGGVFSFVQWLDVRRREIKQRRWDQFQQVIGLVWAKGPDGLKPTSVMQIAAVYQLAEFREFAFMIAISLEKAGAENPPEWQQHVGPHVQRVINYLKSTRAYSRQSKLFGSS